MRIEKQQQQGHKANEEEEMSRECVSALQLILLSAQPVSEPVNPTACIENETVTYAKRKFQFIAVFLRMT